MPAKKNCPRVLIVDDHPDAAESLVRLMHVMGAEATFVTNPFLTVETAQRFKAEVVFLDLGMPGIDGYQLARILRRQYGWERLRIVAITGDATDEARLRSRHAGFDAHLVKPVTIELVESILRHLFPAS